ncbi:MAG TPA: hypothetical protein VGF38_17160 [Ktedonobacterales bacterium]|jgi:hypothetical protein
MATVRVTRFNSSMLSILEAVGRYLHALDRGQQRGVLELDLSPIRFLQADGVLALLSCARLWHRWTQESTILANIPLEVHAYLERTNLFAMPYIHTAQPLPPEFLYRRSSQSRTLLEITSIASAREENARDVVQALGNAQRILASWFSAPQAATDNLLTLVAELTGNIIHSQDTGYIIIQRYQDTSQFRCRSRVTLAIADLGIGIEASLRMNPAIARHHLRHGSDYLWASLQSGMDGVQ